MFELVLAVAAVAAGGIAAVAGFGIGSVLTPVLATQVGTKLAVAAVSIPHLLGTALRFWILRGHVDRRIFLGFGLASAAGGLAGALLHRWAESPLLAYVLGGLLVFAGVSGLSGLAQRMRFEGKWAWAAGALSGVLGGLVGNQGGIRSAAMLGMRVQRDAFVATATAVGLLVDAARMPVYFWTSAAEMAALWQTILLASVGVLAGTVLGTLVLRRIPEKLFRAVVSALVLALGVYMLVAVA